MTEIPEGLEYYEESPQTLRAEMLHQLRLLGEATSAAWEQAVFRAVTRRSRDEVDWSYKPNHTGYAMWLRTFGYLVAQLVVEGLVLLEYRGGKTWLFPRPSAEPS